MVRIGLPTAVEAGTLQERTGRPSTCSVHAPHWPMPQLNLVPVSPTWSRITHRSGVCGSASTVCRVPFTFSSNAIRLPFRPPDGLIVDPRRRICSTPDGAWRGGADRGRVRPTMAYRTLAFCLLALLATVLAARPASAQQYTVDDITVDARIAPDGSMQVREVIAYNLRGRFTFAYRDLPRETRISDVTVTEGGLAFRQSSSREPATFDLEARPESTRIIWYYRADDERRSFVVSYRVDGEVRRHADTAELYYKFIGDQWDRPVGRVRVRVDFPAPLTPPDLRAWAHGPLNGSV